MLKIGIKLFGYGCIVIAPLQLAYRDYDLEGDGWPLFLILTYFGVYVLYNMKDVDIFIQKIKSEYKL